MQTLGTTSFLFLLDFHLTEGNLEFLPLENAPLFPFFFFACLFNSNIINTFVHRSQFCINRHFWLTHYARKGGKLALTYIPIDNAPQFGKDCTAQKPG